MKKIIILVLAWSVMLTLPELLLANTIPLIQVTPSQINSYPPSSLDINCTSSPGGGSSDMTSITSVILSQATDLGQDYTDLATITAFAAGTVKLLVQDGVTAQGFVNPGGESFLHLHWDQSSQAQSGMYKCSVYGLDPVGRSVTASSTATVAVNQPDSGNQDDKIRQMDLVIKSLERKISETDTQYKLLEQKVLSFENERLTRMSNLLESPPLLYNSKQYYISKEGFYHIEAAITMCYVFGGHLVEIDNENEYRAIQEFVRDFKSSTDFTRLIVAGTDEDHDGQWVLQSTKQPNPYLDWYNGSNHTDTPYRNCLYLRESVSWRMDDHACHTFSQYRPLKYCRYMCEMWMP